MPEATALLYYRWIAYLIMFVLITMASTRTTRFFVVIVPMVGALLWYFGWLNDPSNPASPPMLIGATGLIGAGIYIKDTNKEKYGSGGPGVTLMNFTLFMILLSACGGIITASDVWGPGNIVVSSQYQNVDLSEQLNGISDTSGFTSSVVSTGLAMVELGSSMLKIVATMMLTIVSFEATLLIIFPWLLGNPMALAVITVVQIIVWALYAWTWFTWSWKPMPDGGYI
jgi:hypothetical protein